MESFSKLESRLADVERTILDAPDVHAAQFECGTVLCPRTLAITPQDSSEIYRPLVPTEAAQIIFQSVVIRYRELVV
jgi:hypothetical protein